MTAFYNEIEPYAVEWLRNLEREKHIAAGAIEPRSIRELTPDDVVGFKQAHFFAGIGGWSLALRLAGWPDDRLAWTGSCPCQPFSVAGKRKGIADDRHLWPDWFKLIRECRPPVVFGEQVASPDGLAWFDTVSSDLEGEGYAVGAADLCAAGIGAPHIRQRLYFAAIAKSRRFQISPSLTESQGWTGIERTGNELAYPTQHGRREECALVGGRGSGSEAERLEQRFERGGTGLVGNTASRGTPTVQQQGQVRGVELAGENAIEHWLGCEWLPCRDGKARAIEPGTFPLAHGVPNRVGKLRSYGNAIVPQVAATFIQAVMGLLDEEADNTP